MKKLKMKKLLMKLIKKLTVSKQLNEIQETIYPNRERKASSGATIEGLKKRKNDLLDRINSELNLKEDNILRKFKS